MKRTETNLLLNIIDYIERAEYSDDYDEQLFDEMESYLNDLYQKALAKEDKEEC